jgi:hypothetical protein
MSLNPGTSPRGDTSSHLPLRVDQPQTISPRIRIRIASTSPCPGTPTAISINSHSPSRSHPVVVPRGQRVFGGSRGPDRRPSSLLRITFFHQLIFDTPQLAQFISRTPTLYVRDGTHVSFSDSGVSVALLSLPWTHPVEGLILRTPCKQSNWHAASITGTAL